MKKLLLCSASALGLAFATSAWADGNTVYLDQSGDSSAAQTQATIDQEGSNNAVGYNGNSFSQVNGAGNGGNLLSITQNGNGNSVSGQGAGFQSGTGNSAAITQNGTNSDVELQQTGQYNGTDAGGPWYNTNSYNAIVQDNLAYGSKASVYQNGSNNYFDIQQGNTGNTLTLSQAGGGQGAEAYIRQGTAGDTWDLQNVWVPGGGSYNTLNVNQTTVSSTFTYAIAGQGGGDSNNLSIYQYADYVGADVIQNGNSNTAFVSQYGSNNALGLTAGFGQDTPFYQTGDNNYLNATQYNSGNLLNGFQTGSFNSITSTQNGAAAGAATATINQNGNSNVVNNTQTGGVTLTANQYNGNSLTNTQNGSTATALINQTSNGYANYIVNSQTDDAYANLTQNGNNNTINGSQTGGTGNTVTVSQINSNNIAVYAQNGSGLSATITQK